MAHKKNKRIIYEIINKYIKLLESKGFNIWRVYLFGSYASNRYTEDSDIDIAIFLNQKEIDGFNEDVEFMHLRRNIDLRIEPHAFSKIDLDKTNPFIKDIIENGKRII